MPLGTPPVDMDDNVELCDDAPAAPAAAITAPIAPNVEAVSSISYS